MTAKRVGIAIIGATLAAGGMLAAQGQKGQPSPQAAPAEKAGQAAAKKPKLLKIDAARMEHVESNNTDDLKSVVIQDIEEGTVFRADQMNIDNMKSAKTADATGNLVVNDKQADVTGDKLKVYFARSKRLMVLTGNVVIKVKPKSEQKDPAAAPPGPMPVSVQGGQAQVSAPGSSDDEGAASARKNPATITCDKLEYQYAKDKKRAVLTGNFKVVQQLTDHTRTLWADHAEYFALEDRVLLHAPVRWEDTKNNQKGSSPEDVVVYTREGDERLSAKTVEITTEVPDEDEDETGKPAGKPGEKPPVGSPADKGKEKGTPPPAPEKKTP